MALSFWNRLIDHATLDMLREECAVFVAKTDAWLDRRGADVFGITHRGKRYFIGNRYRDSERHAGDSSTAT